MRIATLILSLLLGVVLLVQTLLVYVLSSAADDTASSEAGAVGVGMAMMWLVAAAFVLPFPLVSVFVFALAGALGMAASGEFTDLGIWGVVSFVLAGLALLGWRGKRKQVRDHRAEQARRRDHEARVEHLLRQQLGED